MNISRLWYGLAALLVLAAVEARVQAQPADSPWPQYACDAQHTSRSALMGPSSPRLLWKTPLESNCFGQAVIGIDGTVYTTTVAGYLHALCPGDGQVKWSFPTGGACQTAPAAAADGTVYVGTQTNGLFAVNPDGTEKWWADIGGVSSAPVIAQDGAVVVATGSEVYCFEPDGAQRWCCSTLRYYTLALLSDGDVIVQNTYVGGNGLHRLSADTGETGWGRGIPQYTKFPAIGPEDRICIACYNWRLFCVDPETGSTVWEAPLARDGNTYVSIDSDGSCYAATDRSLEKVAADGTWLWEVLGVARRAGPAAIDVEGSIYCSDGQIGNHIRAFDPEGNILWTFTGDEPAWHFLQPAIGPDGTLYVGSWSYNNTVGYLYAISPEPATLALLAAGGLGIARRRRRRPAV